VHRAVRAVVAELASCAARGSTRGAFRWPMRSARTAVRWFTGHRTTARCPTLPVREAGGWLDGARNLLDGPLLHPAGGVTFTALGPDLTPLPANVPGALHVALPDAAPVVGCRPAVDRAGRTPRRSGRAGERLSAYRTGRELPQRAVCIDCGLVRVERRGAGSAPGATGRSLPQSVDPCGNIPSRGASLGVEGGVP